MRCAEAARLPETGEQTGAVITSEMIRSYLETLSRRGRSRNTVQMYGAKLRAFYHYLPSDKRGEEAECNPWCLRKLYLATRSEIERNVRLPAEQAYEHAYSIDAPYHDEDDNLWAAVLLIDGATGDGRRMRAIPSKRMFAIDIFSPRGVKEEKR